ncbi:LLM class flavin-dependent oxidoreductase [Nocardia terpenica]|uniref:LLM class flavin-dependent oxidoreductase n=1 Tax=Nocardia terpenica TaxID=455432 RepID=UPI002B4B4DD3|nr:LLM class flavin-dependent oxidoreductase [Nocardia terpenica]
MVSGSSSLPGLAVQGGDVRMAVDAGVMAERYGFRSVWTCEFYDRSAIVTLAALASTTSRIELGSSIAWAFGRTPLTAATDFRSLDELSGGRVSMGLGTGNPQVIADWHGLDERRPVGRLVEAVHLVRKLWNLHEAPVAHDGMFYRCHMTADSSLPAPVNHTIPILLAGGRVPLLRAAGSVSDGLIGLPLATRKYVRDVVHPALADGARQAGRGERIPINGMIICFIADDSAKARNAAAMQVAVYATRRSADSLLEYHGFGAEAEIIRSAARRGDPAGMVAAVSGRMLDALAVFGTPEEARDRYIAKFDGLYEQPLFYSSAKGLPAGFVRDNIAAICETFAPVGV